MLTLLALQIGQHLLHSSHCSSNFSIRRMSSSSRCILPLLTISALSCNAWNSYRNAASVCACGAYMTAIGAAYRARSRTGGVGTGGGDDGITIGDDDENPRLVSHPSCRICGVVNPLGACPPRTVLLLCTSVTSGRNGVMPGCAAIHSACCLFCRLFDIRGIYISLGGSGSMFSSCSSSSVAFSSSSSPSPSS